ncbi:MAG: hypothetical protein QOJ78_1163, partial [Pseudonocardiales bacterium]|nr:hypothetical protein [Pseudonocardiales bacterium]
TGSQRVDPVGVAWGLGAATGLAVFFVLSARVDDLLPPIVMAWAGMTVGAVILAVAGLVGVVPFHASTADADFAGHRTSWLVPVVGLSLVAAAIAYTAGIALVRADDRQPSAGSSDPVTAAALDQREIPLPATP